MGIEVGGVEVDIRGRIETLEKDLAQAEAKVRSFDKKAADSGKAAAQARLKEVKAALAEEQRELKRVMDKKASDERQALRASTAEAKRAAREKIQAAKEEERAARSAQQAASKAAREAETSARRQAAAQRQAAREQEQALDAANRLLAEYNPILGAQLRLNRTLQEANQLRQRGLITAEQELEVNRKAQAQYQQFVRSQQKGGGLQQHQLTNLSFQANDVITGLASGQSLGQVAAQQGGQIFQILQQSQGGLAGGLRGLGTAAAGLVNPFTLAAGAVAALGGAFAALTARQSDTNSMIRTFDAQLGVLYDSTQATGDGVTEVARDLDVFGGNLSDIKSNLSSFLREGIDPERLEEFGRASEYLAKVWGVDLKQAGSDLAKAFSGGYQEIENLNKQYPFLNANQLKSIKAMFDEKRAGDARNEAFRIFNEVYAPAYNAALSEGDRLTKSLAGAWDNLISALGNTSAIQGATNAVAGLVGQLTQWLNQYNQVKALTGEGLQSERERLEKRINDPNAQGKYINEANNQKIRKLGMGPLSWAFAPKTQTAEELKQADVDRWLEIVNLQQDNKRPTQFKDTVTNNASSLIDIYNEKNKKAAKDKKTDDEREVERAIKSAEKAAEALNYENEQQEKLNASVAAGTMTLEEASRQQEIHNKLSEYQRALDKATGDDKVRLQAAYDKLNAELVEEQEIRRQSAALQIADEQAKQNAELKLQLDLIGKTNRERLVAIELEKTRIRLRQEGIGEWSPEGMKALGNAERAGNDQATKDSAEAAYGRSPEAQGKAQADDILANLKQTEEEMQAVRDAANERIKEQLAERVINEKQAQQAMAQNELRYQQARLSGTMSFLGNLATLSSSSNKRLAAIGKAAAIAQATIDGVLAVQKALASVPYPLNLAAAATVYASTISNVAQIASMADGGRVRGPGGPRDDKVLTWLSDGEHVMTAAASNRIGHDTLDAMNAGMSLPATMAGPRGVAVGKGATPGGAVDVTVRMQQDGTFIAVVERVSGAVAAKVTKEGLSKFPDTPQFRKGVKTVQQKPNG